MRKPIALPPHPPQQPVWLLRIGWDAYLKITPIPYIFNQPDIRHITAPGGTG